MKTAKYKLPYKQIAKFKACCPICKELLWGENSITLPYRCETHGVLRNSPNDPFIFYFDSNEE